jgi:hypothetical protein
MSFDDELVALKTAVVLSALRRGKTRGAASTAAVTTRLAAGASMEEVYLDCCPSVEADEPVPVGKDAPGRDGEVRRRSRSPGMLRRLLAWVSRLFGR